MAVVHIAIIVIIYIVIGYFITVNPYDLLKLGVFYIDSRVYNRYDYFFSLLIFYQLGVGTRNTHSCNTVIAQVH